MGSWWGEGRGVEERGVEGGERGRGGEGRLYLFDGRRQSFYHKGDYLRE